MSGPGRIDRLKHYEDPEQALRAALDGLQARIWTTIPCFVDSYDPETNTAKLNPAVKGQQVLADGTLHQFDVAQLLDVPVHWPGGGPFVLTFPLAPGDEVLASVACRNINGWWETGAAAPEPSVRTHDLSDAFCVPKVWSRPNVVPAISPENVQLRNVAGDTYVEIDPSGNVAAVATGDVTATAGGDIVGQAEGDINLQAGGDVNITAAGTVTIDGVAISLVGPVAASSTFAATGAITSNGGAHNLATHHHSVVGVQSGGSTIPTGAAVG